MISTVVEILGGHTEEDVYSGAARASGPATVTQRRVVHGGDSDTEHNCFERRIEKWRVRRVDTLLSRRLVLKFRPEAGAQAGDLFTGSTPLGGIPRPGQPIQDST